MEVRWWTASQRLYLNTFMFFTRGTRGECMMERLCISISLSVHILYLQNCCKHFDDMMPDEFNFGLYQSNISSDLCET